MRPATSPIAFYVNRFEPDSHTYSINGRVVPSVTQTLNESRLIDFSGVRDEVLAAARARGTYVHQFVHFWRENDIDLADCDPRFRGYIDSAIGYYDGLKKKPLRDNDGQIIGVEYQFFHTRRMFGGTIDDVGEDPDGVISIDDLKTGAPSDVAAALQTAAYEIGVRDCLLPTLGRVYSGPIRRRAVKLQANGAPGRPVIYDDARDHGLFLAALSVLHYRRNNMRHE